MSYLQLRSWVPLQAMDIGHGEPEEGEDAELAAAIAASLENAPANTLETASSAGGVTYPPSPPTCSTGVALPGLRNEVGEYNCFLNVIVQCLWRCGEFRQEVSRAHSCLLQGLVCRWQCP